MDKPYSDSNYYNDQHADQYNNNSYNNHTNENPEIVQFLALTLILISFSRGCYELSVYTYNKCIMNCKKSKLKCRRLNSADEDKLLNECSICLEPYVKNDKVMELSCNHSFHEKCIKDWMDTNNSGNNNCPICRENII